MLPGSGSEKALKSDGGHGAADRQDRVEIGDLPVRIEQGDQEQPSESAGHGPDQNFQRHEKRPSGAAMIVREVPFTARTGGHKSTNGEAATR